MHVEIVIYLKHFTTSRSTILYELYDIFGIVDYLKPRRFEQ